MRHIENFWVNEGKSDSSKIIPIGFIIYLGNCWYYGAFPTFHDFACKVYEDFSGMDVADEFFGEVFDLKQALWDATNDSYETMADDIESMAFWWGMTPKCAPNILLKHYCSGDPYKAAKELDLAFSDVKVLMSKRKGKDSDAGFIGRSIRNDHSQLGIYIDRVTEDSYFTKEDILRSIPTDIPKELQALIKYQKIKGLI